MGSHSREALYYSIIGTCGHLCNVMFSSVGLIVVSTRIPGLSYDQLHTSQLEIQTPGLRSRVPVSLDSIP